MDAPNTRWTQHPDVKYDWQVLITKGHVWVARINVLLRRAPFVAMCLALALATHDIVSSSAILGERIAAYQSSDDAPNWVEKLLMAPSSTIHGTLTESPEKLMIEHPMPTLNRALLQQAGNQALAPFAQLNQADRQAFSDYVMKMKQEGGQSQQAIEQLIHTELNSLNSSNKLAAVPLAPLDHLAGQWYKTVEDSKNPVYKVGADGAIWFGSVILDTDNRIKPQLGIFHRTATAYAFFNVRPTEQFANLPGFATVSLTDIPRQVATDFPELAIAAGNGGAK